MRRASGGDWRTKAIMVGGVLGAVVGVGAAYLYIRNADNYDEPPEIGSGEVLRLGLLLLGTMRQIAALGQPEE